MILANNLPSLFPSPSVMTPDSTSVSSENLHCGIKGGGRNKYRMVPHVVPAPALRGNGLLSANSLCLRVIESILKCT